MLELVDVRELELKRDMGDILDSREDRGLMGAFISGLIGGCIRGLIGGCICGKGPSDIDDEGSVNGFVCTLSGDSV